MASIIEACPCAVSCSLVSPLLSLLSPCCPVAPARLAAAELQPLEIASKNGVHVFAVEMAVTPEEQSKGLMFRSELPEGQGMLFDFHREQPTSFWMKNTYVPLDMIFIRADGRILRIAENTDAALGSAGVLRRAGARGARSGGRHRQEARHRAGRPGGASDLQRPLVSRFRSSDHCAAPSFANFGIEGH